MRLKQTREPIPYIWSSTRAARPGRPWRSRRAAVTSPRPHCPLTRLYGYATQAHARPVVGVRAAVQVQSRCIVSPDGSGSRPYTHAGVRGDWLCGAPRWAWIGRCRAEIGDRHCARRWQWHEQKRESEPWEHTYAAACWTRRRNGGGLNNGFDLINVHNVLCSYRCGSVRCFFLFIFGQLPNWRKYLKFVKRSSYFSLKL